MDSAYLVNITQMNLVSCCRENEWTKVGSCGGCRLYSEAPDKTTVRKLDVVENVNAPYVSKYSTEGFNIRGNRVVGSVALLPTALLHWTVSCCIDAICGCCAAQPLGTGSDCCVHVADVYRRE